MKKIRNKKPVDYYRVLILRTIGNFLLLSSIFFITKTFSQPIHEEVKFFIEKKFNKQYVVATIQDEQKYKRALENNQPKGLLAKTLNVKPIELLVPQDPDFSIVIPKIGANARILANVDAADEKVYAEALKKGVAHALGTSFPGEPNHIFLFAHSTDYFWNIGTYNAVFYLLYKLEANDEVNLFYQGQRYVYRVIDKKVVDPSEIEYLTKKTDSEFLTLQTCWPPGTTLKRILVFAKRVAE